PDLLDDLDLLVAGSHEHDVELVLLLDGLRTAATTCRSRGNGHGSSRGDAELLLELLQELTQLQDRHARDRVENVFLGGHHASPSGSAFSAVSVTSGSAGASGSAAASTSGSVTA